MQTRLQVILARAGVASRRAAEALITGGKVSVNGQVVAELGAKADPERDEITVSGKRILVAQQNTYVLLNKPAKYITTRNDPEERSTVMELLPKALQQLHPVGRLDWDTEGALLFTDDGALTYALTHPRYGVERVYHIKLTGRLGEQDAIRWLEGVTLEDGTARAETAEILSFTGKHTWLEISLKEGRNREMRRLAEALRYEVLRLRRYSFAGISIDGVSPGGYRFLEPEEVEQLREAVREGGAEVAKKPVASKASPAVERKREAFERAGASHRGERSGRGDSRPAAAKKAGSSGEGKQEAKGRQGAKSFDVTPRGTGPTPSGARGTTRVEGFDEEGNPIRVTRQRPPEEPPRSPHGTRVWVSDAARSARPAFFKKEEEREEEKRPQRRSPRESAPKRESRPQKEARGKGRATRDTPGQGPRAYSRAPDRARQGESESARKAGDAAPRRRGVPGGTSRVAARRNAADDSETNKQKTSATERSSRTGPQGRAPKRETRPSRPSERPDSAKGPKERAPRRASAPLKEMPLARSKERAPSGKGPRERTQKETRPARPGASAKRPGANARKPGARPPQGKPQGQGAPAGRTSRAVTTKPKGRAAPRPKHRGKSRDRV